MLDAFVGDFNHGFGKESLVVVLKWPRHDYLGVTLDHSSLGKVVVDKKQYIDKILSETPPDIKGVAQTPTGEHLFKVNPDCKWLNPPSTMMFHHLVAQFLFLTKGTIHLF